MVLLLLFPSTCSGFLKCSYLVYVPNSSNCSHLPGFKLYLLTSPFWINQQINTVFSTQELCACDPFPFMWGKVIYFNKCSCCRALSYSSSSALQKESFGVYFLVLFPTDNLSQRLTETNRQRNTFYFITKYWM